MPFRGRNKHKDGWQVTNGDRSPRNKVPGYSGPEGRKNVAQGVSPGTQARRTKPVAPVGA